MTTAKRKLTTILSADVFGYSRLMADDERATLETLTKCRQLIKHGVEVHGGRVVDSPGDALLAEFPSAVEALECGLQIQRELGKMNHQLAEHRRMQFRFGINIGDVIEEDGALYGDGVNIAARLESLAEPGGICVSGVVRDAVEGKVETSFNDQGEQHLKNISKPIRVYSVRSDAAREPLTTRGSKRNLALWIFSSIGLLGILVAVLTIFQRAPSPAKEGSTSTAQAIGTQTKSLPTLPEKPSIAVLPFQNMSGKSDDDWFSDGMIETLTTDLSRLNNLFVVARNSSFAYKGKSVDIRQVGRELGVRYILEGSVQRTNQRLRINAQLIDAQTGHHLWAERYDRRLDDIFDIQDEITQHIMTELQVALLEGAQARTWRKTTRNRQAYDLYLKGRDYHARYTQADMAHAQDLFQQALKIDPKFTMAMVFLGWTHNQQGDSGWSPDASESYRKAVDLGRKAIAIDPALGDAYVMMANNLTLLGRHPEAVAAAEKAVLVSPNHADTLILAAWALAPNGRAKEAAQFAQHAFRLNPYPPEWYDGALADSLLFSNRVDEALKHHQRCVEKLPDFLFCRLGLVASFGLSGRMKEATVHATEALRINPKITASDNTFVKVIGHPDERARVENSFRLAGLK